MAFDGIITKKIIEELNCSIIGGKINKVFEPNKNEIILGIYCDGKNYALNSVISSNNYRIHLTTNSKPNPISAPNFCMVLRKHLIGSRIKKIYSNGLERVVVIELEGYNELNDLVNKKLVIELMGKHSNIILLNSNNMIIDSLRHLDISSNSYRDILPAHEYKFPDSDKLNFYDIILEDFIQIISEEINSIEDKSNINLSNIIANKFNGISKSFINNSISILNIFNSKYQNEDILKLYNYIKNVLDNLNNTNTSCNYISNNNDINTVDKNDYTISNITNNDLLQTNFFIDDFYKNKEDLDLITNYRNTLLKLVLSALKKISKKLDNINLKLKECSNMDNYRIYGELITSNLYRINNNINIDFIELENYYDNNNLIKIPLDKSISPSYNAKKYFKKYNKLKNTLSIVSNQKIEAKQELDYLESIIYELENSNTISDIDEIYLEISENVIFSNNTNKQNNKSDIKKNKINKRKVNDEYEPITYNIDGFTLYIGKNNKQNDYITTKLGKNDDLWFHTKDIRGSHCLLKCNGSKVNENTIINCAKIAAYYSKAKLSSNVPVDYCFIKNVKKPSGSKPGMVIFTNNKTVNVNPENYSK